MTRRRVVSGLAAAIAAVVSLSAVMTLTAEQSGSQSTAPPHARRIGTFARGTLRFALSLQLRQRELDAYLRRVEPRPGSGPDLTAAEFGSRFGQSDAQLARLRVILRGLGITVAHLYPQRTAMLVRADVAQIDRVFSLRFGRYLTPDGQRFFAPDRSPRIPSALTPYVTALGDLSDRPTPTADVPASGLSPQLTAKAYDITPLWNDGIRGQGQTIAIATAAGAINPQDVVTFAQRTGITPHVIIKPLNGGTPYDARSGSDFEMDMDIQIALGVAPGAQIIDYQSSPSRDSTGQSLADIYNQVEQDGQAKIVSTSYGNCEGLTASGDLQLTDNALKALETSNVTTFNASGDSGAYGCLRSAQIQPASTVPSRYTGLATLYPATSPYAVSVGGTRLEVRADGSYLTESAWGDSLWRWGGGGGIAMVEPRPAWQRGPGVNQPTLDPGDHREQPDVSGPADPSSGFMVCVTQAGSSAPTCSGGYGGTSAATPFWAASMLLVQQYAAAHGAGSLARCFAGPILYDLAARPQPVPAFHEVTLGNNGYYSAGPGYNLATGLGTPDVFNLAQDYANFLRNRSSRSCPF
jgi:subtilase family serine protease